MFVYNIKFDRKRKSKKKVRIPLDTRNDPIKSSNEMDHQSIPFI